MLKGFEQGDENFAVDYGTDDGIGGLLSLLECGLQTCESLVYQLFAGVELISFRGEFHS